YAAWRGQDWLYSWLVYNIPGPGRRATRPACGNKGPGQRTAREVPRGRHATNAAEGGQPLAITLARIGLSTISAITAATTLRIAATMNTACQLPVLVVSTLASGTRSAAVPFAV